MITEPKIAFQPDDIDGLFGHVWANSFLVLGNSMTTLFFLRIAVILHCTIELSTWINPSQNSSPLVVGVVRWLELRNVKS